MGRAFDFIAETGDGVFAVDADQRIVLWNEAARRMLGYAPDEVVGKFCYTVVGGTDENGCTVCRRGCRTIRTATRREIVPTCDLRIRTKEQRWICVSLTTVLLPSRWRELSVLAHIFRDVSLRSRSGPAHEQFLRTSTDADAPRSHTFAGPDGKLTPRETEVLRLLTTGASTDSIAKQLRIGRSTVRTHVQRVLGKLGVHSRLEAATLAVRNQLL